MRSHCRDNHKTVLSVASGAFVELHRTNYYFPLNVENRAAAMNLRQLALFLGFCTRANSICLTKTVVKIGAFPNATPTSKIWKKFSVDQKDHRRRSVKKTKEKKIH